MSEKVIKVLMDDYYSQNRKQSLIDNMAYWCEKRDVRYEHCTPNSLSELDPEKVGAIYHPLSSFYFDEPELFSDEIPFIIDVATPYRGTENIYADKKIAFRSAFAMPTGKLNPELQVPMLPRPLKPQDGVRKDVIVFDVKDFHDEETHFYVMSLMAQFAREWKKLEKIAGHKLFIYFTSFMKYEEYLKFFSLITRLDQFSGASENHFEQLKDRVIPNQDSTEDYHRLLQRARLCLTEHGDIADTDLTQMACLGTPILTYKRVPFAATTGFQHMAIKGAEILHPNIKSDLRQLNRFRVRENWGLQNIIRIKNVPPWDFDEYENLFLKSWDILWEWALTGNTDEKLTAAMSSGKWNKGVKLDKKLYTNLIRYKKSNNIE